VRGLGGVAAQVVGVGEPFQLHVEAAVGVRVELGGVDLLDLVAQPVDLAGTLARIVGQPLAALTSSRHVVWACR
jgi:hypothetical protein